MTARAQLFLTLVTVTFWAWTFSMAIEQIDAMPLPQSTYID